MKALAAVLFLSQFALAAAPPEFIPDASIGRYENQDGAVIEIERVGKGITAALDGKDLGEAHWWASRLVAGKSVFVITQDKGRLVLASKEEPDRPFVHQGDSPWWRLLPETRAEFTPRLTGLLYPQAGKPEEFGDWFTKTYGGTKVTEQSARAEHIFDTLDRDHRESLLALYAKLVKENAWEFIGKISYVGQSGDINFYPDQGDTVRLRKGIAKLGYADVFRASDNADWGVRSLKAGVELHFKTTSKEPGKMECHVHIDFFNPASEDAARDYATALRAAYKAGEHIYKDLYDWAENHTTDEVIKKVEAQGIKVERSPN